VNFCWNDQGYLELEKAFDVISERYYLNLKGEPKVTVGSNEIRVRFSVEKDD